jgi:hypothetical protein
MLEMLTSGLSWLMIDLLVSKDNRAVIFLSLVVLLLKIIMFVYSERHESFLCEQREQKEQIFGRNIGVPIACLYSR